MLSHYTLKHTPYVSGVNPYIYSTLQLESRTARNENGLADHGEAPRCTEGQRRDGAYKRLGRPQTTAPHEER